MTKKTINHNTEANNVDKVLSNHLGKLGLNPDQYDMNFTIFNELTNSNVRPDCCIKIGNKYGVVFENKIDYKNLQGAKIQGLKYLELLKKNNALCNRSLLIVTDGISFDVGQYEIQDDVIVFIKALQIDIFDQITIEWMNTHAGDATVVEKKTITSGDKAELKKIFDKINNYLRDKGLGKDSRLHITSAMLFLKLIKENDDLFQIMDKQKVSKIEQSLDVLRAMANESSILTCFDKLAEAYEGDFNFNLADYKEKNIIEGLFSIVDELHLDNYDLDIKGEAFEYFINYGNTSSDMGEYFTPRHIVNFMIRLLGQAFYTRSEKRFGKTYMDPTCGTGGFLIKIFQRIQQELKDNNLDTPANIQKLKAETVYGNELNLRSSEIAKMNMILTGDGHSNIFQGDFLEQKQKRAGKYDVTIGNPPFGGKKEKSEVHFVDGFLDDVKNGGYSIIVIPEGILFNSNNEFVKLRKKLLNQGRILSIISLPKGVFLPYAGVKTDIIFWEKSKIDTENLSYDIEMVEIRNDGYSLDSHRRPLTTSDLDLYFSDKQALIDNGQIYSVNTNTVYDVHELATLESEQVALTSQISSHTTLIKTIKKQLPQITDPTAKQTKLERIEQLTTELKTTETTSKKITSKLKGFDVNLVVSRYRPRKERNSNIDLIKLGDVVDIYTGSTPSRTNVEFRDNGIIPWFTIDDIREQGRIINKTKQYITPKALKETSVKILPKGSILLCCTASVGEYAIANIELTTNQQFNGLVIKTEYADKLLPKYLFYIASSLKSKLLDLSGVITIDFVSVAKVKNIEIPLPSLEEQQRIVNEIEKIENNIQKNENQIKNLKEDIQKNIDAVWGE